MGVWVVLLVVVTIMLGVSECENTTTTTTTAASFNQTDLQAAMTDMRSRSYYGFVILLKILNTQPNSLQNNDLTFLMPSDEQLSHFSITPQHLHDFLLSHSIPTPLLLNHLLHFPNGSVIPSSIPTKSINITNSAKSGFFLNNARIVTPNVCQSSLIRCHGISAAFTFDDNNNNNNDNNNNNNNQLPLPPPTIQH